MTVQPIVLADYGDWPETANPGVVYRFFDAQDRLLYVGSTSWRQFQSRMRDHKTGEIIPSLRPFYKAGDTYETPKSPRGRGCRPWYRAYLDGGCVAVEYYTDRATAFWAEQEAIRQDKPYYNGWFMRRIVGPEGVVHYWRIDLR